jgi:fibronectin-binding autotransporter adhesin
MKAHSISTVSERGLLHRNAAKGERLLAVFALGLGLTLAVVCLVGAGLRVAHAASFTVITTADDYNGVCDTHHCSLRDAIVIANGNGQANTISLSKGTYVLTRTGAGEDAGVTGDLDITSTYPITIVGVGADLTTIDATGIDRVLDIRPGAETVVISGVTIYNGNPGAAEGGGIRDADADLVLINTVVMSNAATSGGGVYVYSGTVTLSGGQIARNAATGSWPAGGGGVYVYQGSATLSGGQIVSNTAASGGGGVYVYSGTATLSGGQIVSNTAGVTGGGVHVEQSTAAFTQTGATTIARNTASSGGGVFVYQGHAALNGGQIVSNTASSGGGAYVGFGSATLSGGQIVSNTAGFGGGVFVSDKAAAFTQTGASAIARNTAAWYGGGVYVVYGNATLSGGQIASNAAQLGGGVYVGQSTAAFTQTGVSTITLNSAYNGGGVYVYSGTATLNGGQIVSNAAVGEGGGVYVEYGSATLNGGQIVSNTAGIGGGVCVRKSTAAFTQTGTSTIAFNAATAGWGGGVLVTDGRATLSGGQITRNIAAYGGGVHVNGGRATLSGGQIVSNIATDSGGGVVIAGITSAFTQTGASTIAFNTASNNGGGVWVAAGRVTLSGGQIVSNTAQLGSGIYNLGGTLALVNSTVSGNKATGSGGGLYSESGTSVLTFTTVASNTAASGGGGIHLAGGAVLLQDTIVAYNGTNCNAWLTSNGHNLESGHTCGLGAAGDMPDTDPLLGPLTADGGSLVHPLLAGSPAINHGVCIAGITTDQRGVSRPQGTTCDIGAYEWIGWKVYLPLVLRSAP